MDLIVLSNADLYSYNIYHNRSFIAGSFILHALSRYITVRVCTWAPLSQYTERKLSSSLPGTSPHARLLQDGMPRENGAQTLNTAHFTILSALT